MLDKKYNGKEVESKIQKHWEDTGAFKFKKDDREVFSIDNPPPTVSGNLHIGHIFSYTQTEMVARYKRLQGFNVFYPFGFDDNGLPSERLVEKERDLLARDVPRSEFAKICTETVQKYEKDFRDMWTSLGFSVDWALQYETISPRSQRISQRSFIDLYKKGHAYRHEKPVLWCTNCRTSIAQAELDSKEADSVFYQLPFLLDGDKVTIATTRPEMLGACVAVMVHPEDERYKKYQGKTAVVPLYENEVPVIADEKVAMDKGTGVVMCCTYGDGTDLEWVEKYNLPYVRLVEASGLVNEEVPHIGGQHIKKARKILVALLDEKGLILDKQPIRHTVSVHERCGTEVEIIPSWQWYISVLDNKQLFMDAGEKINWYPKSMKTRYDVWVENLKWDWNISRQRYFGVPIPVWYCKNCGEVILPEDEALPVNPLETSPTKPCKCGCTDFVPEEAVMDTWATSSVSPLINGRWQEPDSIMDYLAPMSLRTQAHEIIRTWAFYTIVKSMYHLDQVPWKDIMVSGFVLAKKGEKISKSKGNAVVEPGAMIEQFGADAVRYWAANNRLGTDTWFEVDDVKQSHRFLTKIWNAARFALMHLEDFDNEKPVELLPADRWILDEFYAMQARFTALMDEYEIGLARKEVDDYFWHALCDDYIEFAKERMYEPEKHGAEARRSAQKAILEAFHGVLQLYSIFVPHITEHIFLEELTRFYPEGCLSVSRIEQKPADEHYLALGKALQTVLTDVRKYKSVEQLSRKDELARLDITCPADVLEDMKRHELDLAACLAAKEIAFKAGDAAAVQITR